MNKKHVFAILVALFVFSVLSNNVRSENEPELEILKNHAIAKYGLNSQTIQTLDFGCWRSDSPYDPKVCYGAFEDSTGKHIDLWVNLNTTQFFNYKPSFHQLYPEVSPKIDAELWYEMINASPNQEIQIRVTKKSNITETERKELEDIGMNVTFIEDKPERWLSLTGYKSIAHGTATKKKILDIANLSWVYGIFVTKEYIGILEDITSAANPFHSALIVSNSIDLPTADRLKEVFEKFNISTKIINASASEFQNPPQEYTYAIRFILGGPKAYEGVGELSAQYLSEEEKNYLINTYKAYGFWSKQGIIGNYTKRIIIIAGYTRNETSLAEMEFESKKLNEEGWLIGQPTQIQNIG